jgi:hypothetical protein
VVFPLKSTVIYPIVVKEGLREMSEAMEQEAAKMPKLNKGRLSSPRIILLGTALVLFGTLGFYTLPGMIDEKATGSHFVNSFYCAVMTLTT